MEARSGGSDQDRLAVVKVLKEEQRADLLKETEEALMRLRGQH